MSKNLSFLLLIASLTACNSAGIVVEQHTQDGGSPSLDSAISDQYVPADVQVIADSAVGDSAVIDGAVIDGAVIDGAVIDGAVIDGAVIDSAVIDGAVIDSAVIDGAVIDSAVIDGAVIDGAVIDGAVIDGAVIDGAVIDGTVDDATTPDTTLIDPCVPNPCTDTNKTQCDNSSGAAVCLCDDGYEENGSGGCALIDPCVPNPCTDTNKTQCDNSSGAAVCLCDDGYEENGSGGCALIVVGPCDPNPCTDTNRTQCDDSSGAAVCLCDLGFEEDGLGGCVVEGLDPCASGCGTGISGRITHGEAAMANVSVSAYTGACPLSGFVGSDVSDAQGFYYIATGEQTAVYIRAGSGVSARWYNAAGGTTDCAQRDASAVTLDQTTTDRDIAFAPGGAISGRIVDDSSPVGPGLRVNFYDTQCGSALNQYALTDDNGDFLAVGLPAGSIYVEACSTCRAGFETYADRWWTATNGSSVCADASPINVQVGQLSPGANFDLQAPGQITGLVTLGGQPVSGVLVHARSAACGGEIFDGAFSDETGAYNIDNLPAGTFYLETRMRDLVEPRYVDMWWTSGGGAIDCNLAESSVVSSAAVVSGRDFSLQEGGQIAGRITASGNPVDGVYVWAHVDDCARNDEWAWYQPALTDSNGDFVIPGLPQGTVRVYVSTSDHFPAVTGWWTGDAASDTCEGGTSVSVTDANLTGAIDFVF